MLTNGPNSRIAMLSNKMTLSSLWKLTPLQAIHNPLQDLISIYSPDTCWHSDSKVSVSFWHALPDTENVWQESHTVCKVRNRKGTDVWSFSPIVLSIERKQIRLPTAGRKDSKFQIQPLAQSENKLQTPQPQPLQQLQQHHHQQQQQSTAPSPNVIGSQVRIAREVLFLPEGKVHCRKIRGAPRKWWTFTLAS